MNKIVLVGNFIKDPELMCTEKDSKTYSKFIIAVDRPFKSLDGTRKADLMEQTII